MSDDSSAPDSVKKLFPELEMNDKLLNLLQLKGIVIETAIRKGSFGHVYRGWHQKLEKPIALKVLFLEAMNPQLREKLLPREIETMRQISQKGHPHLVAILDVMHASRKLFILMELANSDLAHILAKTGPITEPITAHLMGQAASGLQFLHIDHRFSHRDLKLENVLFFGQMVVKLADFGFSRQSWDWTNNRPILCESFCGKCSTLVTACPFDDHCLGTGPYLSPQLLRRQPYNPYAADCYAFGILLFCLLNNAFPFHYQSPMLHLREQHRPNFLDTRYIKPFSADLLHLLKGLLHVDENSRMNIQQVLEHGWIKQSKSQ